MQTKYYSVILLTLICFINCNGVTVTVNTNNGKVIGRREISGVNHAVNAFLGIPYAQPPIGHLRFKKPEPVKSWSNPIDAKDWPNPCIQMQPSNTFQNKNVSEDCLYLNIWTPVYVNNGSVNARLKAVMFWIHGGGLIVGSSNEYQFNGKILSSKGDVVVVSINYRLGTLGFLYSGTHDAPGNMGLWDIVLALQWVADNIGHFGGDPNSITIFGHSGGSWAVSILILSTVSRYLYSQAILISGALISFEIANKTVAKENWLKASKLIGCANEFDIAFNAEIMDCMRSANTSDLANVVFSPDLVGDIIALLPMVTIDGVFLPYCPLEMFESRNYKTNLNLLIGTVEDEGQAPLSLFSPTYSQNPTSNLTYSQARHDLQDFVERTPLYRKVDVETASQLYFGVISPKTTDQDLLRITVPIAIGDLQIGCQTIYFGQSIFKYDHLYTNVYQYHYISHFGGNQSVYSCADWMGACHGSDLTPMFGLPFMRRDVSSKAQKLESERVIDFYSHFAKNGYPSPQNGIEWPKYYLLNEHLVTPYYVLNNTFDLSDSYFSYGLKITECEYLWKKYVYVKVPNCKSTFGCRINA